MWLKKTDNDLVRWGTKESARRLLRHVEVGFPGDPMCDYSLNFVASRPAKVGDKLVSTRFDNSLTRGFAAVEEPSVAVCLRPGTEIAFEKEVECNNGLGILPNLKLGETLARFRQLNMNKPNMHHDALEFPSGKIVLLHKLCEGQHATILQLPAVSQIAPAASQAEA